MKLIGISMADFIANIRHFIKEQKSPETVFPREGRETDERNSREYRERRLYNQIKRPAVVVIAGGTLKHQV